MARARIMRILVYEGEAKWIIDTLQRRGVKGEVHLPGLGSIKEGFVGDLLPTPEGAFELIEEENPDA